MQQVGLGSFCLCHSITAKLLLKLYILREYYVVLKLFLGLVRLNKKIRVKYTAHPVEYFFG